MMGVKRLRYSITACSARAYESVDDDEEDMKCERAEEWGREKKREGE